MYKWECPSCGLQQQTETLLCAQCRTERPAARILLRDATAQPTFAAYVARCLAYVGCLLVLAAGLVTLVATWWYGDSKPWWLDSSLYASGVAAVALSLVVWVAVSGVARRRVDGVSDPTATTYVVRRLAYEGLLIVLTSVLVILLASWWRWGISPSWIAASMFVGGVAASGLFLVAYVFSLPGMRRQLDGTGDPIGNAYVVRAFAGAACLLLLASSVVTALDAWRYRAPDPWWMTFSFFVGGAAAIAFSLVLCPGVSGVAKRRLSRWLSPAKRHED
jgi:hypothetical protein